VVTPVCTAHHDEPTTTAPGLRLCAGHANGLTCDLQALPGLHRALEQHLIRVATGGTVVSVTREPGIDLDPSIVRARDHIWADLHCWTSIVFEERHLHQRPVDSIPAMAAWLGWHTTWLAASPWAAEVADDFATSAMEARAAIDPNRARRLDIGPCPEQLLNQDTGQPLGACPGQLYAIIRPADSLLPSAVYCTHHDDHAWTPNGWHALGRRMARTGWHDLAARVGA
jgi:hypothetical protein